MKNKNKDYHQIARCMWQEEFVFQWVIELLKFQNDGTWSLTSTTHLQLVPKVKKAKADSGVQWQAHTCKSV
jgi:hypothetical protein